MRFLDFPILWLKLFGVHIITINKFFIGFTLFLSNVKIKPTKFGYFYHYAKP